MQLLLSSKYFRDRETCLFGDLLDRAPGLKAFMNNDIAQDLYQLHRNYSDVSPRARRYLALTKPENKFGSTSQDHFVRSWPLADPLWCLGVVCFQLGSRHR